MGSLSAPSVQLYARSVCSQAWSIEAAVGSSQFLNYEIYGGLPNRKDKLGLGRKGLGCFYILFLGQLCLNPSFCKIAKKYIKAINI